MYTHLTYVNEVIDSCLEQNKNKQNPKLKQAVILGGTAHLRGQSIPDA